MAACERIRALQRMSQQQFADHIGIKRTTYRFYCRGGTLSVAFVQKVVRHFPEMRPYVEALFFGAGANLLSNRQPIVTRAARRTVAVR